MIERRSFTANVLVISLLLAMFGLGSKGFSQQLDPRAASEAPGTILDQVKEVQRNESEIFESILNSRTPGFDKWYSPHLRDLALSWKSRQEHVYRRAEAGVGNAELASVGRCYGACGLCDWRDPDQTQTCCGVQTEAYANLSDDSNFKTCCVRNGEQDLSEEEIACRHPEGDGWAGLYEYYYPVNAIEWSARPATTSLATSDIVNKCVEESDAMMSAVLWGGPDQTESFSKGKRGEGALTLAVNISSMSYEKRKEIARHFCMHDDQFLKLMDAEADPIQRIGAQTPKEFLYNIPLWANYCPAAVKLMTDPDETALIQNIDRTPTDLFKGLLAFRERPEFCSSKGEWTSDQKAACLQDPAMTEAQAYRMSPVTFSSAAERRASPYQRAVQFAVAAGYYKGGMVSGGRRYYKPFEPRAYTESQNLFRGQRIEGGGFNELGRACGVYEGDDLSKGNHADKIFTSPVFPDSDRRYWATFRAFATCPLGYEVWKGPHSEARGCGAEYFGGKTEEGR